MPLILNVANRPVVIRNRTLFIVFVRFVALAMAATFILYTRLFASQPEELHKFPLLTNPDSIVAQDGTGDFATVSAAVAAAPSHSKKLFVIHIKAGVYKEIVRVGTDKTNLVFVGDGIDQTIIIFDRTTTNGFRIADTATLDVRGDGFMATNLTIENSASRKGRAIALRTEAAQLTFYLCKIKGHRHTLSAESGEQFFRDCEIYGTTTIIVGDATAVFQKCNIYALEPHRSQKIVFFVQERYQRDSQSGFVFHKCRISAGEHIPATVEAYIGRPPQPYSRVVVMQSFIDRLISPSGWLDLPGNSHGLTAYFGEYQNQGPGSDTRSRVRWPAFRVMTRSEAKSYTVSKFFKGDEWLARRKVPYVRGLI